MEEGASACSPVAHTQPPKNNFNSGHDTQPCAMSPYQQSQQQNITLNRRDTTSPCAGQPFVSQNSPNNSRCDIVCVSEVAVLETKGQSIIQEAQLCGECSFAQDTSSSSYHAIPNFLQPPSPSSQLHSILSTPLLDYPNPEPSAIDLSRAEVTPAGVISGYNPEGCRAIEKIEKNLDGATYGMSRERDICSPALRHNNSTALFSTIQQGAGPTGNVSFSRTGMEQEGEWGKNRISQEKHSEVRFLHSNLGQDGCESGPRTRHQIADVFSWAIAAAEDVEREPQLSPTFTSIEREIRICSQTPNNTDDGVIAPDSSQIAQNNEPPRFALQSHPVQAFLPQASVAPYQMPRPEVALKPALGIIDQKIASQESSLPSVIISHPAEQHISSLPSRNINTSSFLPIDSGPTFTQAQETLVLSKARSHSEERRRPSHSNPQNRSLQLDVQGQLAKTYSASFCREPSLRSPPQPPPTSPSPLRLSIPLPLSQKLQNRSSQQQLTAMSPIILPHPGGPAPQQLEFQSGAGQMQSNCDVIAPLMLRRNQDKIDQSIETSGADRKVMHAPPGRPTIKRRKKRGAAEHSRKARDKRKQNRESIKDTLQNVREELESVLGTFECRGGYDTSAARSCLQAFARVINGTILQQERVTEQDGGGKSGAPEGDSVQKVKEVVNRKLAAEEGRDKARAAAQQSDITGERLYQSENPLQDMARVVDERFSQYGCSAEASQVIRTQDNKTKAFTHALSGLPSEETINIITSIGVSNAFSVRRDNVTSDTSTRLGDPKAVTTNLYYLHQTPLHEVSTIGSQDQTRERNLQRSTELGSEQTYSGDSNDSHFLPSAQLGSISFKANAATRFDFGEQNACKVSDFMTRKESSPCIEMSDIHADERPCIAPMRTILPSLVHNDSAPTRASGMSASPSESSGSGTLISQHGIRGNALACNRNRREKRLEEYRDALHLAILRSFCYRFVSPRTGECLGCKNLALHELEIHREGNSSPSKRKQKDFAPDVGLGTDQFANNNDNSVTSTCANKEYGQAAASVVMGQEAKAKDTTISAVTTPLMTAASRLCHEGLGSPGDQYEKAWWGLKEMDRLSQIPSISSSANLPQAPECSYLMRPCCCPSERDWCTPQQTAENWVKEKNNYLKNRHNLVTLLVCLPENAEWPRSTRLSDVLEYTSNLMENC